MTLSPLNVNSAAHIFEIIYAAESPSPSPPVCQSILLSLCFLQGLQSRRALSGFTLRWHVSVSIGKLLQSCTIINNKVLKRKRLDWDKSPWEGVADWISSPGANRVQSRCKQQTSKVGKKTWTVGHLEVWETGRWTNDFLDTSSCWSSGWSPINPSCRASHLGPRLSQRLKNRIWQLCQVSYDLGATQASLQHGFCWNTHWYCVSES